MPIEFQETFEEEVTRRRIRIINFVLDLKTEDLPAETCEFCTGPTNKIYIRHTVGTGPIRGRADVPGYHCNTCGTDWLSNQGCLEILEKARDIFSQESYFGAKEMGDSFEHEKRSQLVS